MKLQIPKNSKHMVVMSLTRSLTEMGQGSHAAKSNNPVGSPDKETIDGMSPRVQEGSVIDFRMIIGGHKTIKML